MWWERDVHDLADVDALRARHAVTWLDVVGVGDASVLNEVGSRFGLHRLALEDVQHVHQRTKVESYPGSTYVVLHAAAVEHGEVAFEQVSLFLGPGWVITIQERPGDSFDPIRARLREGRGRLRTAGADYLAYALMDAVVDEYFVVLDHVNSAVDALEDEVAAGPRQDLPARLQLARADLMGMRRAVWPLRDLLASLHREQGLLITDETRLYLRDCHDHAVSVMDLVDSCRERSALVMELHLAAVGQRMNEIMKVLTIISTIFMPLSFVAGIYGMNFDRDSSRWNMPELGWVFGYPFALGVMAAVAGGMLLYFRRKGWLGGGERVPAGSRE